MSEDQPLGMNLEEYQKMMRSEIEVAAKGTSDEIEENARTRLVEVLPDAVQELVSIVHTGTKDDGVRLSAIKLVLEYAIGKPKNASTADDDISIIIKKLQESAPAPSE